MEKSYNFDSVITEINLDNSLSNRRYWFRMKLTNSSNWSAAYSFTYGPGFEWFIHSSANLANLFSEGLDYDSISSSWKLSSKKNILKITSAGSNEGRFASILYNGTEELPNTFFWGLATAEIDTISLMPYKIKYFTYPTPQSADSLMNYLNRQPEGKVIAFAICDDGAQSVLGYSGGTPVKKLIAQFGSLYIDSVRYRESWCMIGKKGAAVGSVPENYSKLFAGQAAIDTSLQSIADSGYVIFPKMQNAVKWQSVTLDDSLPQGASLNFIPLGIQENGKIDTLSKLDFSENNASLQNINADKYPEIKFAAKFFANSNHQSPVLNSVGVNYLTPPELAINSNIISINKDSVIEGSNVKLIFPIYNVGNSKADSFFVRLQLKKNNNSVRNLFDSLIISLDTAEAKFFHYEYFSNKNDGTGNLTFEIQIDPQNRVKEFFEDNNQLEVPFFVKPDTTATSVSETSISSTFNGINIFEGDYISSTPDIQTILNYPAWFPTSDTSAVQIYIDQKRIFYSELETIYDTSNRRIIYKYNPVLSDGEHTLRIFGKNISGKLEDSPGYQKSFKVSNEVKILDAFNFPNPFKDRTEFTFKLTQLPDELKIKIYTVAGRLIREIRRTSGQLNYDFNRIAWNGKDEDGDIIANGVYLYKIIIKRNDKTESVTQKLAVMR